MKKTNNNGFTILELMIATIVFAVIFMGATTAILQIAKLYYKGVVTNRTQESTRSVVDSISQQIQFNDAPLLTPADVTYDVVQGPVAGTKMTFKAYCIGSTRYTYAINAQVNDGVVEGQYQPTTNRLRHGLWRDTVNPGPAGCIPANLSLANPSTTAGAVGDQGVELLAEGMRLSNFALSCDDSRRCSVAVAILSGDNDLLEPNPQEEVPTNCATIIGNQWCAGSQLTTVVLKRVGE